MSPFTLIDAQALSARIRTGDLLVVDCRFELADPLAGARAYAQGHVPGAVYASLDEDLSDLSKAPQLGRHPLPEAFAFSAALSRWGWTPDTPVVAYDAANGAGAFALMAANVPEPSTVVVALTAGLFILLPAATRKRN